MSRRSLPLFLIALTAFARQPVRGRNGMVVAAEPTAADVGVRILKQGGNAVDAAIGVAFALAVTYPFAGNLGGGGFMLVHMADGRSSFIDFREKAPAAASRNMYLDPEGKATRESLDGWRASGVPGTVRGMELAHQKFATKKWGALLNPAIELAKKGSPVSYSTVESLKGKRLSADPAAKHIFQRDGKPYEVGDKLIQADLARTLRKIQKQGAKVFYEGEIARTLAAEMAKHGGLITLDDLKNYTAVDRKPLSGSYKGFTVLSAPPPSSGGIGILQMLALLEGSGYEKSGAGSAASIHYLTEVMRRFFADRSEYLGDPDFIQNPVDKLLDPVYVQARRATIDPNHATPSAQLRPGLPVQETTETTHFSIVDKQGNAVAMTYTLNEGYGTGIVVPGLGFLLNDEMDDFASKPGSPNLFGLIQGEKNAIQPNKRPLSAMSPTILLRDGKVFMVAGSPGGPRIITAVLQAILNVVDFGMNVQDAVDAPRIHHQWMPDKLSLEHGISPDTVAILRAKGHDVDYSPGIVLANVAAIVVDGGWIQGAADARQSAKASGY